MCTKENMYKDMFFSSLGKRLASKYCKKFKTAAKIFKFTATKFNQTKYGKILKKKDQKLVNLLVNNFQIKF